MRQDSRSRSLHVCYGCVMSDTAFPAFAGIPAIASSPWAYPVLESLHIIGVALLLGNLVLLELRVWGRGAELPVQPLARLALAISVTGFGLLAITGLLMFAAAPGEMLANRAFVIKMGLVMLAGLNAAWFHARQGLQLLDATARAQTLLSLGLWITVIILGRWIAYL
jgi:hypothetical protein